MEWIILPLKRYADFAGRSRRKELWLYWLFVIVLLAICMQLDARLGLGGSIDSYRATSPFGASFGYQNSGGILTAIVALALTIPSLAVVVRRLHDYDKSGWWLLIGLIPFFGALYLLFLYVQPGTRGPNRFGPDPLTGEG